MHEADVTENARVLIAGLLDRGLGVPCGIRVFASFLDGVCVQHKLAVFRVPAHKVQTIRHREIRYDPSCLERIARELCIDTGASELVIEYQEAGRLAPRWVDFSISWISEQPCSDTGGG